jgi:hypothetical protein
VEGEVSDYHRPTYTFPIGAYNATEVRLYGKPGILKTPGEIRVGGKDYTIKMSLSAKDGKSSEDDDFHREENSSADEEVHDEENSGGDDEDIEASILQNRMGETDARSDSTSRFLSGLPITPIEIVMTSIFLLESKDVVDQLIMLSSATLVPAGGKIPKLNPLSWGVIYSYAYEGHCYDLPKPKVMLLPVEPAKIPFNDAGYYQKRQAGYKVWSVDKLSKCLEIDVNQGFVEQLVLEANLPGKRAPTMYAGKMMMGHRSGRLSE